MCIRDRFITLYLGMLAQIPLGIIQVISAIILTYITYLKSRYAKKHLTIYWFQISNIS